MGDVTGQHGPGNPPRDETDGRDLHPLVGRVWCCCDGQTNPTPRRRRNLSLAGATLRGGGGAEFWTELNRFPTGNRGVAMVHRGMLPRP